MGYECSNRDVDQKPNSSAPVAELGPSGDMTTIEPVEAREPFFDGWETGTCCYTYRCRSCGTEVTIGFSEINDAAWGWREKTEGRLRSTLAAHFRIDLGDTYIGNGMDAVVVSPCPKCAHTTCVYFWVNEYRHSCYQVSLRGLSSYDA